MSNIKVGDKVECIPGFITNETSGGSGYRVGREFIVGEIRPTSNGLVAWESGTPKGVYTRALRLISDEPNYEIY